VTRSTTRRVLAAVGQQALVAEAYRRLGRKPGSDLRRAPKAARNDITRAAPGPESLAATQALSGSVVAAETARLAATVAKIKADLAALYAGLVRRGGGWQRETEDSLAEVKLRLRARRAEREARARATASAPGIPPERPPEPVDAAGSSGGPEGAGPAPKPARRENPGLTAATAPPRQPSISTTSSSCASRPAGTPNVFIDPLFARLRRAA